MQFRCDDYTVRPVSVRSARHNAAVIAPLVTLRYNGGIVWEGVSWSVAYHLHKCRQHSGDPPWRESLDIELRCVGVDGDYLKYAIL